MGEGEGERGVHVAPYRSSLSAESVRERERARERQSWKTELFPVFAPCARSRWHGKVKRSRSVLSSAAVR